ncbi:MAG: hypothetical protein QNI84_08080 [Henriciella sp.]|nr:hypothetical protein [Henriciella sp.]
MPAFSKREPGPRDPNGISYVPNASDPDRAWALTLPAPLAGLIVAGKMWGHATSLAPPNRLMGKRIALHGGQHAVRITPIKEDTSCRNLIALAANRDPDAWRAGLDDLLHRHAGRIIGSAVLAGGYILGGLHGLQGEPRCASAWRVDSMGHYYRGDWQSFSGKSIVPVGDWSAPDAARKTRRWVWCFRAPALQTPTPVPFKGFGGLWDLGKGEALRRKQQADAAALEKQTRLDRRAS